MTIETRTHSVWHRALAPQCHIYVWRTSGPEGTRHSISVEGQDLEQLDAQQATMLAGALLLASKFARREQELAEVRRGRAS